MRPGWRRQAPPLPPSSSKTKVIKLVTVGWRSFGPASGMMYEEAAIKSVCTELPRPENLGKSLRGDQAEKHFGGSARLTKPPVIQFTEDGANPACAQSGTRTRQHLRFKAFHIHFEHIQFLHAPFRQAIIQSSQRHLDRILP